MFSPFLFDLQPGDTVEIKGPYGYFVWRSPPNDSILVATGTGIAPFRGMLLEYFEAGGDRDITLIFGVRYEESLLYRAEFESLAEEHPNFHFWPTLTRPGPGWEGRTGTGTTVDSRKAGRTTRHGCLYLRDEGHGQ